MDEAPAQLRLACAISAFESHEVRAALAAGANPDPRDYDDDSTPLQHLIETAGESRHPLHVAAACDIARLLIEAGANPAGAVERARAADLHEIAAAIEAAQLRPQVAPAARRGRRGVL